MVHKKILEPVLERLDGERAGYFAKVIEKLDEDPRTERAPNLVFLVLKETVPYLPIYLEPKLLIFQLLTFVHKNRRDLNQLIYSPEYINDPDSIKKITNKFVAEIMETTLEKYDDGQIESGEQKVYRVSWPYNDVEFPFVDDD